MTDKRFFEFLRIAINGTGGTVFVPRDDEWQQLFDACRKQALTGVGFTAVEVLHGQGIRCPRELTTRWMALAMQIEQRNKRMNRACAEVCGMFIKDGFDCCMLKGQGNLLNYPEHLAYRRQSGDIDLWARPRRGGNAARAAIAYARRHSRTRKRAVYHHIDMPVRDDTEVELHFRPSFCRSFVKNRRLQRWFADHADECMGNMTRLGFPVPTPSVNVIYQMCHVFSHFFHEGIGLRQLMDYYFTLKRWHDDCMEKRDLQSQGMWSEGLGVPVMSREEVMRVLCSFGMEKFAAAVMWVLHEVFAMPAHYICEPDERRGRQLLDEIMLAGNFGQYDERGRDMKNGGMVRHGIWKLRRVMRLVRNYPEEALCEPLFRVWHLGWRLVHG